MKSKFIDKEIVYKYRTEVFNGNGFAFRDTMKLTEYFIPVHNICFNQYAVFKSEKPRNMVGNITYSTSQPLTSIQLSEALIDDIRKYAELNLSPEKIQQLFAINEEFQSLFKEKPHETVLVGNEIRRIKRGFWERYEEKGNNVIKKAIVQYIIEGVTPNNVTLNDLYEQISKLNQVEKQSIIDSAKSTLSMGDDRKLTKDRLLSIKKVEDEDAKISTCVVSGIGGGIASLTASVNPLLGIGIGFFSGFVGTYVYDQYQKYQVNHQYDEREFRAMNVLDAIDTGLNSSLTNK